MFPRLIALAERAWHQAEWELTPDPSTQRSQRSDDWQKFANSVGHRELARLDRAGVMYRVPPPGAFVDDGHVLRVSPAYPGLQVQLSRDDVTWQTVDPEGERVEQG